MFRLTSTPAMRLPIAAMLLLLPAATLWPPEATSGAQAPTQGIHKIRHVVIIMQENRSFDHYFGTFPGADGIPMATASQSLRPRSVDETVRSPYHDSNDVNGGGPHGDFAAAAAIDHGRMDGFIWAAQAFARSATVPIRRTAPRPRIPEKT